MSHIADNIPEEDKFDVNIVWPGPGEECPICHTIIKEEGTCECKKCKKCNTIFYQFCLCKTDSTKE